MLTVSLTITNIGRTPALHVITDVEMTPGIMDLPSRLQTFCKEKRRKETTWSRSLLAGESYQRGWVLSADREELQPSADGRVFPGIIGCVTYQILPDNSLHQTGFVYTVCQKGPMPQFPRFHLVLEPMSTRTRSH